MPDSSPESVRTAYAERVSAGADHVRALHAVAIDLQLSLEDCAAVLGNPDEQLQSAHGAGCRSHPAAPEPSLLEDHPALPAESWRRDRVGSALAGTNPTVMHRLPGGFAVIGDVQFLPGYCVLLTDRPGVDRLSDLPRQERTHFLESMDLLARAVESVCGARDPAFRRVNLEILGNADAFLHAHVWPRFEWEPAEILRRPVWLHPARNWSDPATGLGPQHAELRAELTAAIAARAGR